MVRRGESIIINGARIARGRQKYINRKKKRMDSLGSTIYLIQNMMMQKIHVTNHIVVMLQLEKFATTKLFRIVWSLSYVFSGLH